MVNTQRCCVPDEDRAIYASKAGGGRWNNTIRFGAGTARPRVRSERTDRKPTGDTNPINHTGSKSRAVPKMYRGTEETVRSVDADTADSVRELPARNLMTGDAYARAFSMPASARAKDASVMAAIATRIHASLERFASINETSSYIVPHGEPISLGACRSPSNDQLQNH